MKQEAMNSLTISILLLLLFAAAWQDFRAYYISNAVVSFGALLGVLLNASLPEGIGIIESFMGWGIGFLLLLPLYLLRMMGAGDIKLMAMVGAFVGTNDILGIFLNTLITGGVLAFIISLQQGMLGRLMENLARMFQITFTLNKTDLVNNNLPEFGKSSNSIGKIPYAIAIAIGTVIFLTTNHLKLVVE